MPCPTCNDAGIVEGEACIVAFHPDHPERLRIPQARPGHRRHALRHLLSP
jgi:hypothetical protein